MKIFICGFTGAGKTSLLKDLKRTLSQKFHYIDLDEYITKKYLHLSIADFIDEQGFEAFRKLETKALLDLDLKTNIIVSLGGGALSDQTVALLKGWKGLFLNTPFEICYKRIQNDPTRPITKSSKEQLLELYNKRLGYYSKFEAVENAQQGLQVIEKWDETST